MDHYFKVYFEIWREYPILVRAKDVFEAGSKAARIISDRNGGDDMSAFICEITRTNITEVIE